MDSLCFMKKHFMFWAFKVVEHWDEQVLVQPTSSVARASGSMKAMAFKTSKCMRQFKPVLPSYLQTTIGRLLSRT